MISYAPTYLSYQQIWDYRSPGAAGLGFVFGLRITRAQMVAHKLMAIIAIAQDRVVAEIATTADQDTGYSPD